MDDVVYRPIGVIRTPFPSPENVPVQPADRGAEGRVELRPEYEEGLKDLDGFSHVLLVFHLHLAREARMLVKPFLDDRLRGVFATRAPARPNPIGLSVVRLLSVERNVLRVAGVDIVDHTPLLDLKPCIPDLDLRVPERLGWLEGRMEEMRKKLADRRFSGDNADEHA